MFTFTQRRNEHTPGLQNLLISVTVGKLGMRLQNRITFKSWDFSKISEGFCFKPIANTAGQILMVGFEYLH